MNDLLMTQEGYQKLVAELDQLKTAGRKEVAEHLKEAISYGDLSENSEYEEAKTKQAFVEGRILELENKIRNAKIVADGKKGTSIGLGSTVTVAEVDGDKEKLTFTVVGQTEADPYSNKISNESPLGSAVIDKKLGDVFTVNAPRGILTYKVMKVG